MDLGAARARRPGRRRGQGAGRERPARSRHRADRAWSTAAGKRAADRRLPAASSGSARLAPPRRALGAAPLTSLLPNLLGVLGAGARVEAPLEPAELALELAPAVESLPRQRPAPQRLRHGAAGLALVRAVAVPTRRSRGCDVVERLLEHLGDDPELQLAQP